MVAGTQSEASFCTILIIESILNGAIEPGRADHRSRITQLPRRESVRRLRILRILIGEIASVGAPHTYDVGFVIDRQHTRPALSDETNRALLKKTGLGEGMKRSRESAPLTVQAFFNEPGLWAACFPSSVSTRYSGLSLDAAT